MPAIAALIPAHNEADTIAEVVRGLAPFGLTKILVVDDASDDGTGDAARIAGAEVLRLESEEGGGKGQAIRAGLAALAGDASDFVLFLDGDGQHDPSDLAKFLAHLDAHPDTDFLIGSRRLDSHRIPKHRWWTNVLGSWVLSRLSGVPWEDTQSGFRLVRKRVLDRMDLKGKGFTIEMEMALKASHHQITWGHVPIRAIFPEGWASHFQGARDVLRIMFFSLQC